MSLDRSLKSASSLVRHRNVLTRAERIDKLAGDGKWTEAKSVFGLPKVGHRKQALAKAEKAVAVEGAVGADATTAAAGAKAATGAGAGAKGAVGAKAAAPAAGAKAAVPAAGAKAAAPAAKKK